MKKVISLLLSVILLIGMFTACTNAGTPAEAPSAQAPASDVPVADANAPAPITFDVFMTAYRPYKGDAPILQLAAEATGVSFNIQTAVGMESERLSIMLASKDYPDIITMARDPLFYQFLESGDMLDLKPILQENAPTVYNIYNLPANGSLATLFENDAGEMLFMTEDLEMLREGEVAPLDVMGANYVIPNEEYTWHPNLHTLFPDVQEIWGKKIGSLNDLYEALKADRAANPDSRHYPMTMSGESGGAFIWQALAMNKIKVLSYGTYGGVYATEDGTNYQFAFKRPEVLEFMKEMNRFYREGLIDQEGPVQTRDRFKEKLNSGQAFAWIDSAGEFIYDANENLIANEDTKDKVYIPQKMLANGVDNQWQANYAYTGNNAIMLPKTNKDPARYAQFLEWLYSDEGLILTGWGVEGEDYIINADGLRDLGEENLANLDAEPERARTRGLHTMARLINWPSYTSDGQRASYQAAPVYMEGESSDARKRAVAESVFEWHGDWSGTWWKDYYEVDIYLDAQSDESKALAQAFSLVNDAVSKMVMASSEAEVEGIYNETVAQMNAVGIEKWEGKITDIIAQRRNK